MSCLEQQVLVFNYFLHNIIILLCHHNMFDLRWVENRIYMSSHTVISRHPICFNIFRYISTPVLNNFCYSIHVSSGMCKMLLLFFSLCVFKYEYFKEFLFWLYNLWKCKYFLPKLFLFSYQILKTKFEKTLYKSIFHT